MGREWTKNQARAIEMLDRDVCVAAGAGSGKTGVLVARFVRVVVDSLHGALPQKQRAGVGDMLVITFTEKATREMKARLVAELTRLGLTDERRALETAYISTIHGFCSRVLQENPFEAGVDPGFSPLDPTESARLRAAAFDRAVEQAFVHNVTPITDLVGSREIARTYGSGGDPLTTLYAATKEVTDRLRSSGMRLEDVLTITRSGADAIDRFAVSPAIPFVNGVACTLRECLERIRDAGDMLVPGTAPLLREVDAYPGVACDLPMDASPDAVLAHAFGLAPVMRGARQSVSSLKRLVGAPPEVGKLTSLLDGLVHRLKQYETVDEEREQQALIVVRRFWVLLAAAWEEYDRVKRENGVLDSDDLQAETTHLLLSSPGVLQRYRRRFRHLMIDEFQDTSPIQMNLVRSLHNRGEDGELPNTLFIVGDAQQSIYSFRDADPAIFQKISRQFRDTRTEQYQYITLADNFRSRPEILTFVNHLFQQMWRGSSHPFMPLESCARFINKDIPCIEALVGQYLGARLTRQIEVRALAHRIREMVDSREVAITREDDPRCGQPIGYGDIAVLFRVFTDIDLYEAALAEAGVPSFVVGGGRKYYARSEVRDVRNLLTVLDTPLNDVAVAAVLRSPMAGLDTDTLVRLSMVARERASETGGRLFPAIPLLLESGLLPGDQESVLRAIYQLINSLRADPNGRVGHLLERAITETQYDARVLVRPNGRRRLANVRKLLAMAHSSEDDDIARFVQHLRDTEKVSDREGDAPTEEEASDVVRLITVHRAKGLEFPVVFVADMGRVRPTPRGETFLCQGPTSSITCKIGDYQTLAYRTLVQQKVEADEAESTRVLYVALTRAREHLVLCGCAKAGPPNGSWSSVAFPLAGIVRPDVAETRVGPSDVSIRITPYDR